MQAGGKGGFPGSRFPHQEDRRIGAARNQVKPFDQRLQLFRPGFDAAQQQGRMVAPGGLEPALEGVVAREVKVDDVQRALQVTAFARRTGLDKTRGHMAAFGQQEPADLRHMGAGGQVDVIALAILVEAVAGGKVVELAVDLLEVPGVLHVDVDETHLGFGRNATDGGGDDAGQVIVPPVVDQLQPVDGKAGVLAKLHRGAPFAPLAHVKLGAEEADDDVAHGDDPFG